MSGWVALALFALASLAALRLAGAVRGPALMLVGVALFAGGAGYALQGRPGLGGSPASKAAAVPPVPLDAMRRKLFGRFTTADRWLTIADSYLRRGDTWRAVGVIRSALRAYPRDAVLWTGLGNALLEHGGGRTSPASELAFARAMALAPDHPGPLLFAGLARMRSGEREPALALWRAALVKSPAGAEWRPGLERSIALLEGLGG